MMNHFIVSGTGRRAVALTSYFHFLLSAPRKSASMPMPQGKIPAIDH